MASATAAPANRPVRRSSATVAATSGAMLNSETTITSVVAWMTPNRTRHKIVTAIATCSADGRDLAVTPALPLARAASSRFSPCFTGFSARFGTCHGDVTCRGGVRAWGRWQRRRLTGANGALDTSRASPVATGKWHNKSGRRTRQ